MATADSVRVNDRQWYIVHRWLEYDGESRANLLRIMAIGGFYLVQLVQFYWLEQQAAAAVPFHQRATALAVAGTMVALGITLCLRRQIFPAALKYVSATCDIVLVTALVWLAGGPLSPSTRAFFVVIALAALRFDLGLIWYTTLGCLVAYEGLVGSADKKWFDAEHAVPVVDNLLMLVSLALTGLIVGQVIRRVRQAATDYAARSVQPRGHK
jgi:hypothetical protein